MATTEACGVPDARHGEQSTISRNPVKTFAESAAKIGELESTTVIHARETREYATNRLFAECSEGITARLL